MSNLGLEIALRERGARLLRTAVGDRYVVEAMQRGGYNLGGEQSGHLILLDHGTTGDGLAAGLTVASLMVARQRPLGELKRVMTKLPQVLRNVRVARREDLDTIPAVRQVIESVRAALNDRGRVLVRYSGTEPLIRVMVEGEDAAQVEAYAAQIAAAIAAALGLRCEKRMISRKAAKAQRTRRRMNFMMEAILSDESSSASDSWRLPLRLGAFA